MPELAASNPVASNPAASDLAARAVLVRVMASAFGPGIRSLSARGQGGPAAQLAEALDEPHVADALRAASARVDATEPGPDGTDPCELSWVRWFEHSRIPPYELSNLAGASGGHAAGLADVAAFYRAVGLACRGERPDHLVAEVEYLAVALELEARALEEGDADAATRCASAARLFLRDHLGRWVDGFAARVAALDADGPWAPLCHAIALLVGSEARRHNVIPLRSDAAFPAVAEPAVEPGPEPSCDTGLLTTVDT